jgi:putative MATE family efflux protein
MFWEEKMKEQIQLSDHFTYGRLIRFTLPSIGMMIFMSIYSVVDGYFVSNFAGKTPFAALNLIFPVLMIMSTLGFMFGTGGSAIVAKTFGMRDSESANRYFSLFVYIAFGLGVILAVISFVFLRPIAILLGAEGQLLEDAVLYGRIILLALPFNILQMLFQSFFVTAEKPGLGLVTSVCAGVANMVLDAILVISLPQEYKLAGAAIATATSQVLGGGIPLLYFGRKNSSILRLGKTKFEGKVLLRACINGSSEFMSNIAMNIVGILYNLQLLKYAGENGIAAYGVMMYVSFVFSAAFIGYSIGSAPLFGFNDGARNSAELKNLLKKSLLMIGIFAIMMVLVAEVLATPLAKIFVSYDTDLLELTVSGFRIYAISFLFMGYAIFGSGFFTALNDGVTSAIISFLRTLVFQTASVMLLPLVLDIDGIWYSVVVAELMAIVISAFFLVQKRKKYHYM